MTNTTETGAETVVEVQVNEAQAEATKAKMAVKNASKLSNEALAAKLRKHGVEVPADIDRNGLLALLKEHKLWNYEGNIIDPKFKVRYAANGGNCGDQIAAAFGHLPENGDNLRRLAEIAGANGVNFARWDHCNYGQKRMNLGNVLRAKIKRGENVIIHNYTTGVNHEWNDGTDDEAEQG